MTIDLIWFYFNDWFFPLFVGFPAHLLLKSVVFTISADSGSSCRCRRSAGSRGDGGVPGPEWKWTSGCWDRHRGFHCAQPSWRSQQSLMQPAGTDLCLGSEIPQRSQIHFWGISKDPFGGGCRKPKNQQRCKDWETWSCSYLRAAVQMRMWLHFCELNWTMCWIW